MIEKIILVVIIAIAAFIGIPWVWNFVHPIAGLLLTIGVIYGVIKLGMYWFSKMSN